jgi:hypothetical protein
MAALCPRFASVFWTLTWADEDSGRPTEHFQFTISGRPLRFDQPIPFPVPSAMTPRLAQQKGEPGAPGNNVWFGLNRQLLEVC